MDFSWQLLKVIFYLIFIILLFYILVKFLKKQVDLQGLNQNLKILERVHFNSDQALCLVEVVDEIWVVGVSEKSIELLDKIAESDIESINKEENKFKKLPWQIDFKKYFSKDGQSNE
jgi:flagellar protein FliO/FliZ